MRSTAEPRKHSSRSVTHWRAAHVSVYVRQGLHLADIYDAFRGRPRFVHTAYRSPRFNGIRRAEDNTRVMEPVIPPLTARDGTGADRSCVRLLARRHVRIAMGSASVNAKPLPAFARLPLSTRGFAAASALFVARCSPRPGVGEGWVIAPTLHDYAIPAGSGSGRRSSACNVGVLSGFSFLLRLPRSPGENNADICASIRIYREPRSVPHSWRSAAKAQANSGSSCMAMQLVWSCIPERMSANMRTI